MTNEIREYAEQEFDEVEVEEEHVHWAPWSSAGANTSMNYESSPPRRPEDADHNAKDLPEPARSGPR